MAREPDDFDFYAFEPPALAGLTLDDHRQMPPSEKMRRVFVAFGEARAAHRVWYLERYPDASAVEVWGDWLRVTGCAAIIARGMRDAAQDADEPILVRRVADDSG